LPHRRCGKEQVRDIARIAKTATRTETTGSKTRKKPEPKFEDEVMAVAEQLIIKGKEQGTPPRTTSSRASP
jgi:hypothetical protein